MVEEDWKAVRFTRTACYGVEPSSAGSGDSHQDAYCCQALVVRRDVCKGVKVTVVGSTIYSMTMYTHHH